MAIAALLLAVLAASAGIAFVLATISKTAHIWIIIALGLAAMVISLALVAPDKDGNFLLLGSIPYLLVASIGAALGCATKDIMRKEQ